MSAVPRLSAPPITRNPSGRTPPVVLGDCAPGDVVEVFRDRAWHRVTIVGLGEIGVLVQHGPSRYVTQTWDRNLLVRALELRPARA